MTGNDDETSDLMKRIAQEEELFASIVELVDVQMATASALYQDQLASMGSEQQKAFLAFELGVIEYFDQTTLRSNRNESEAPFFNFLIFCAKHQYQDRQFADDVFRFWQDLAMQGAMTEQRKLGYDSINNQTNPDGTRNETHFPGRYLRDALGLE